MSRVRKGRDIPLLRNGATLASCTESARSVESGDGLRRSGRASFFPNFSKDYHSWDCHAPLRGARNDNLLKNGKILLPAIRAIYYTPNQDLPNAVQKRFEQRSVNPTIAEGERPQSPGAWDGRLRAVGL